MIKQPLFFKNLLKFHFHFRFQAAPKEGKKTTKYVLFKNSFPTVLTWRKKLIHVTFVWKANNW
uniref:Uncharacterized protein n=1 Tax=Daphnia magna TaxID=35525 RepID=A0A0P6FRP2_9CRUS